MSTATDVGRGVMDRFRSLPVVRWAMPFGQSAADLLTGLPVLALMVGCGLAVGWRPHEGAARTLAAFALILLMRMSLGWVGIWIGLASGLAAVAVLMLGRWSLRGRIGLASYARDET